MIKEIEKLTHNELLDAGTLLLTTPMSKNAFLEKYTDAPEELKSILSTHIRKPENNDFYTKAVLSLLNNKTAEKNAEKYANKISDIFIDFEIPFSLKTREYVNQLDQNGTLDNIQDEFGQKLFEATLYTILFYSDEEDPLEIERARLEFKLKVFKGELF